MLPIIVSHYTVNTPYEQEVKNLRSSLEGLRDLIFYIEPIKTRGSWRANSNYCSQNVLNAMLQFPDRNILRVDADARFHQLPALLDDETFKADVAAHIHDFPWNRKELLGGTLYFRNTLTVQWLVRDWVTLCLVSHPGKRPGDLLQLMLEHPNKYNVTFEELPPNYCKIFDLMKDVEDDVIVHHQASRRFKHKVNRIGRGY